MSRPAFDKGLESMIAEVLRVHVVDSVFAREAVKKGLPPDRIEALRREIVDRLRRAEEGGRTDRETVRAVLDAALGIVPGGGAAASVVHSVLDRLVPKEGSGADAAPGPEAEPEAAAAPADPADPEAR